MKFTFFWLDGRREVLEGDSVADAFNSCYSAGAMRALDFYASDDNDEYEWNKSNRSWDRKEPLIIK